MPADTDTLALVWNGPARSYCTVPLQEVFFELERRDRQRVTQPFSRFLDSRVVKGLVEKGETDVSLSGQKREITVLFSDIQGFPSLSEHKSAQEIVDLLNRYFSCRSK